MKIYKKQDLSLMFRPYCADGKTLLSLGALMYFDLAAPDALLSDQDLWKDIPEELSRCKSQSPALDEGMPKPRGEFLVLGDGFALAGETTRALEVKVQVGALEKRLLLYGDRAWSSENQLLAYMTEAEPFARKLICWENAYGGEGFEPNPVGKGFASGRPKGNELLALPNVEHPDRLIGAPSDRPEPAGFGPLSLSWPPRSRKTGTYDEIWMKTRWPYFPQDMDPEFFNLAPPDQWLPGYFKGDELIRIERMHEKFTVIESRLPAYRARCLVRRDQGKKELVIDATLRAETLWLFPNLLRGVLVQRGVVEIGSEELDDVRWLYLTKEPAAEPPLSLDHHLEEQRKMSSLSVDIDPNLMKNIAAKVDKEMSKIRVIPKLLEDGRKQAMGQAPCLPNRPALVVAEAKGVLADRIEDLKKLEAMALDLNRKHGPVFSAKTFDFSSIIAEFKKASAQLDTGLTQMQKGEAEIEKMKKDMGVFLKTELTPEQLAMTGLDPDNLAPDPFKRGPWHNRGFDLLVDALFRLNSDRFALQTLEKLDFQRLQIKRSWLGLNLTPLLEKPEVWGLAPETTDPAGSPFEIPPGLLLPYFEGPELKRLTIRPLPVLGDPPQLSSELELASFWDHSSDFVVPGSVDTPLFRGTSAAQGAPVLRVTDELDAWHAEQELGELLAIAVLKTPDAQPGEEAAAALKDARQFVVLLPADPLEAETEKKAFLKLYPEALFLQLPKGSKTLEAVASGFNLREEVLELLDIRLGPEDGVISAPPGPPDASFMKGFKPPVGDIKAMVMKFIEDINAIVAKKTAPLKDIAKTVLGAIPPELAPHLSKAGIDPAALLTMKPQEPNYKALGQEILKTLDQEHARLKTVGVLTKEAEKNLVDTKAIVAKVTTDADKLWTEGMARIKATQETCAKLQAGELPPEVTSQLQAAGVNPDMLKQPTPEEMAGKLARKESLAGANLNGLDLSGLDFSNADLTQAMCVETRFVGAKFDGATMYQIMATGADFTGASFRGANLRMGLCVNTRMDEADLSDADLTQTLFKGASMRKARFQGATLFSTILEQTDLGQADFSHGAAQLTIFSQAKAQGASFRSASLLRCAFGETLLDDADFSLSILADTMFQGATGERLNFKNANMNKARMGLGASFPGADFSGATMVRASFMDTDLNNAKFTDCLLEHAILQSCDLRLADLRHVQAREIRLNKSDLTQTKLMGANLLRGSLRMATLYATDLRGANLYGVDFYKAKLNRETLLDKANLTQAVFLQTFMDKPGEPDA